MDGSCLPESNDFILDVRHPCLFPRRPTARVTFLSGKVTKAIGAGHDGLANIRLARLPCASRRARAGANKDSQAAIHGSLSRPHIHVRALAGARQCRAKSRLALSRAPGCDARRHATAPESSLRHGHPWPAFQLSRGTAMLL
jgi:hypothetical protein